MTDTKVNRRDFLKIAAVGAATIAGTRAMGKAEASSGGEKGPHQWAMVIDQAKCKGCGICVAFCPIRFWNWTTRTGDAVVYASCAVLTWPSRWRLKNRSPRTDDAGQTCDIGQRWPHRTNHLSPFE